MKKVERSSKTPKKKEEKKEKELSRFRIGERPFIIIKYIKQGQKIPERYFKEEKKKIESKVFEGIANGITEAEITESKLLCFLLNQDIFEYDNKGWKRIKNIGKSSDYDWDSLGISLNGTTFANPDFVESAILKSGKWSGNKFDLNKQGSHDFVQFCLKSIGSNLTVKKSEILKSNASRK